MKLAPGSSLSRRDNRGFRLRGGRGNVLQTLRSLLQKPLSGASTSLMRKPDSDTPAYNDAHGFRRPLRHSPIGPDLL